MVRTKLASVVVFNTFATPMLFSVLITTTPVTVVTPNCTPVAPVMDTKLPAERDNVVPPLSPSVPNWKFAPAPEVRRSTRIATLPLTVVLRAKLRLLSLASCSVPPVSARVPAPSAPPMVVARSVPAESVSTPLKRLLFESVRVPGPTLVRLAVTPETAPPKTTSEFTVKTRVTDPPSCVAPLKVSMPLSARLPKVMFPPIVTGFDSAKSPTPVPVKPLLEIIAVSFSVRPPEPSAEL